MEDLTGKQFGHYQIVAPLGEGGMAAVYKAFQPSMERFVAVKVLPRHMATSEEFVNRFRREARLLAQLQHPHILPVFDYGEAEGYPYIVMPFVTSGTLADLLHKRRVSLSETRRILIQIGDALAYAHARGMIHRDIKPSNVLIDERGNCLLTDFGLARMAESATKITTSGTVMGTPAYMSPEQGAGSEIDHRTDIYSLGIIFYEMVTGRVPYQAETPIAVVFKHIQDPLPSARKFNLDLPEAVELVLLKVLAKSPDERYQTAEDFVQAIQRAVPEGITAGESIPPTIIPAAPTVVTPTPSADEKTAFAEAGPVAGAQTVKASIPEVRDSRPIAAESPKPRRFPVWAFAAIGVLALVAVGAIFLIGGLRGESTPAPNPTRPILDTSAPPDTPAPLPTSPPTVDISPGVNFRDDFDGQLAEGWTWLAEDPSKWSLTEVPGSLQIIASDASINGPALPPNILLREAPAGDFEITTSLRFMPTRNFQFAGLVVFHDDGNILQFGRAFCDIGNSCVGDGVYFDNYENDSMIGSNFKTPFRGPVIYLRLQRVGNIYRGSISEDGQNWSPIGEHARDFSQARVGLMAAQAPTPIPAVFDYFTVSAPSTVTRRTEILCRAQADGQAEISLVLPPNTTAPIRGVSLDRQWLNIQRPDAMGGSCWIPFDAAPDAPSIQTAFECADPLGCVQIGPSDPFHIAFWGVLSGPEASLGQDALRGVEIAVDDLGGNLHGHDILLTTQDALCTTEGGAAAARQLAGDPTLLALVGSTCSNETIGGMTFVTEAGLTTISPSNTRASLTAEDRGPEYAGYLRTAPGDALQGRVVAEFAYSILGVRRVAIIHDESSYSVAIQQVFSDHFTQLGGQIVAREKVSSGATNMGPVLTRIAGNNPEMIYYPVFVAEGGAITAQIRGMPGLENVKLIASDAVFSPDFLATSGPSAQGVYISSPDFSRFPVSYGAFVDKYLAKYGTPPISSYHAHAYDAAAMIFAALRKVAVVESDGVVHIPRQALRNALYATHGLEGMTGTLTCSPTGDCSAPAIAIYEVIHADPALWNPGSPDNPNPRRIYP